MSALKEQVRLIIATQSESWWPGLAAELAAWKWSQLALIGLGPEHYGVERVLKDNPNASRTGAAMAGLDWGHPVWLAPFDEGLATHYAALDLVPPASGFSAADFERDLAAAIAVLDLVEGVSRAVRDLVWTITPVAVEGADYDTGFSDPEVPFSIFLGAHAAEHRVSRLRLAEGLLHEAMHLQLSLVEEITPLVVGRAYEHYSPWQKRPRPTQGLLHGLYVFRAVQAFFEAALTTGSLSLDEQAHARGRIAQIDIECAELEAMGASKDLTAEGRALVDWLVR